MRGTTTDSWHVIDRPLTWNLANLRATLKTIIIVNTGDTNSLDYRIITKADEQGEAEAIEYYNSSDDPLEAGKAVSYNLRHHRDVIAVDVKSHDTGKPTTFEIQTSYEKLLEI